jgi:endonuclease/exonuclease/phosphatase family metal-dependent hydrolase
MIVRIATLNLEQDHKCWEQRRELIAQQLEDLRPDIWALNEIHIPSQTGRWLQRTAEQRLSDKFTLLQQSKAGEKSRTEAEGLLARHAGYSLIEAANLDYQSHNCVALVARFQMEGSLLEVYVTHLIAAHVPDSARQYQVSELLDWIRQRNDADHSIVCGDFNAPPDQPSIGLMSKVFPPTQTQPTAFTPLSEPGGEPTHPDWPRFDRCIDYIWVSESVQVRASGLCFDKPALDNPNLWPSDHIGVWADIELT